MEQSMQGNPETPEMEDLAGARREVEALRRDIETLRADLRNVVQSAKGASKVTLDEAKSRVQETAKNLESWAGAMYGGAQESTQRLISISRESIQKRPFATVAGAVAVGMVVGRMRAKH